MADQPADHPPARRRGDVRPWALWAVVALLVGAAAVLWAGSRLVWTWEVDILAGTSLVRPMTGSTFQPAVLGLAAVALAAVAAVLATSGWLRRVVGGLVALGGLAAWWLGWLGVSASRESFVSDSGFERWLDDIDRWRWEAAFGVGCTLLAGMMLIAAGLVLLATGHRMRRMGGRYRTPGARRATSGTAGAPGERAIWDEQDAGRDPTA